MSNIVVGLTFKVTEFSVLVHGHIVLEQFQTQPGITGNKNMCMQINQGFFFSCLVLTPIYRAGKVRVQGFV